ncbi:hypothetical protein V1477_021134 [Vespula maculifrons]|uniref:Uncharacterized protein n=1 Tax=Vespula maculifrons TaxID=7453 RepID=A0ABD2AHA3_VESMC
MCKKKLSVILSNRRRTGRVNKEFYFLIAYDLFGSFDRIIGKIDQSTSSLKTLCRERPRGRSVNLPKRCGGDEDRKSQNGDIASYHSFGDLRNSNVQGSIVRHHTSQVVSLQSVIYVINIRNTKRNKDGCHSRSPKVLQRNRIVGYVTYEYFREKYAISITLNVFYEVGEVVILIIEFI